MLREVELLFLLVYNDALCRQGFFNPLLRG